MNTTNGKANRFDKDAIKQSANGHWRDIISAVAGIDAGYLDGRKHPCPSPSCGGTDRFEVFKDFDETGGMICRKCFDVKNGDGFAAVMHYAGCDFKTALTKVADFLGVTPSRNGKANSMKSKAAKDPVTQVRWGDGRPYFGKLLTGWCKGKPPIVEKAAEIFGARFCWWPKGAASPFRCIAFTGRDTEGETKAIVLFRVSGKDFPEFGSLKQRKAHSVGGSVESWLYVGDPDTLRTAKMLVKCEGMGDALALLSKGLPDGWIVITNACGAKSANPKKLDFDFAKGKKVAIVGDADTPGQEGGQRFAVSFTDAGASDVRLVKLPYEISDDHGKDLRDWLNEGHGTEDFIKMVEETETVTAEEVEEWKATKRATGKPTITVSVDEARIVDEAIAALTETKIAGHPTIYQRGGVLVHVVRDQPPPPGISRPKDAPRIVPIRLPRLQELLASAAIWERSAGEDETELCHPPGWAVKAVDARGEWLGVRRLDAVVESPILRANGSVLQTPGYDAETGLIFAPQSEFPEIPSNPTRADAVQAVKALMAVIVDFPFGTDAHRSAWLSGVLTPLSRFAFHGPAPLHLMDANVRGCGKSLLVDVTGVITAGRAMARMTQPHDEDEFRKRITSLAMAGESLILIDNVAGALGGASLDAALTATTWSDRILGRSEMASNLPLFATWYATGNNVVLLADTARRTLHVRLESPEENPEERAGFRHPDLLAWVRKERPRLTVAAMTVLRGYCAAGRPSMGLTPWGSFEGWSDLVRQSIVWCGLPDPGETRQELSGQADVEAMALAQLIDGWAKLDPDGSGLPIASVLDAIADFQTNRAAAMPEDYQQVRDAINELVSAKGGRLPTARSVGMKLKHLRRRIVGGRYFDKKTVRMGNLWYVKTAEPCGTSGTSGTCQPLARGRAHEVSSESPHVLSIGRASPASPASPAEENLAVEEFLRS